MRNFSLLGLLIAIAIIAYMAKSVLAPSVSHNSNDKSTVEYWVSHDSDRETMLAWCQHNPSQQNSQDCKLAITAQTEVDAKAPAARTGQGVDQGSAGAADQLQAQQDANSLP